MKHHQHQGGHQGGRPHSAIENPHSYDAKHQQQAHGRSSSNEENLGPAALVPGMNHRRLPAMMAPPSHDRGAPVGWEEEDDQHEFGKELSPSQLASASSHHASSSRGINSSSSSSGGGPRGQSASSARQRALPRKESGIQFMDPEGLVSTPAKVQQRPRTALLRGNR